MTAENVELKAKVANLENEFDILQWYLSVMEDGVDTKEVVKDYAHLKADNEKQIKESSERISNLETENKKLSKRLDQIKK